MYNLDKLAESSKKIAVICSLWVTCLFFYYLVIYLAIDEVAPGKIGFFQHIASGILLGLLFGLSNGFLEVLIFRQKFRRIKFIYTVLLKTIFFFTSFITVVILFIIIKNNVLIYAGIFEPPEKDEILRFIGSPVFFKHGLFAVIFSFIINFLLQIDNKMGRKVLFNLFIGKFHSPRRQKKILMFLDLTSSTSIAEKIGDFRYSAFLRDFFFDLDEFISETKGAVYQYVGDEVVVVWEIKDGTAGNNCIKCYFESQNAIQKKKSKYLELYGEFPQFKAGVHLGDVIVTEVGGLKSEIAFHGDTINTASRLCASAKNSEHGLLISGELLSWLTSIDESYCVESIGIIRFKGKKHDIAAFSVSERKAE